MKTIILIAILSFFYIRSNAQMTFAHSYGMTSSAQVEIVNLSRSGKKIMTTNFTGQRGPDTLFFYNLDYSFWKMIACPVTPWRNTRMNLYDFGLGLGSVTVYYPSESLFNTDTFLEAAVLYYNMASKNQTIYIVNENSTIMDSIPDATMHIPHVYEAVPGVFKLAVPVGTGVNVYNLPGTIPCDPCGRKLGLAGEPLRKEIPTQPIPNPSSNEVKIKFTLPEGTRLADLKLYNADGRLINSYKVDSKFGYIILDNSLLPAGMYFYNIAVDNNVSSTQKLLVVK